MTIRTRTVDYVDGDTTLEGLVAWDDAQTGTRPGVLVSHAWGGRSELEDGKAIQLAELGYVGLALDLYGKGVRGSSPAENSALMQPFLDDRQMLQTRLLKSLDALREQPEVDSANVAAIGFCFGGLCVLDIARTGEELRGVVSFHGLFSSPDNPAAPSGRPSRAERAPWPGSGRSACVGAERDGRRLADARVWQYDARFLESQSQRPRRRNRV